jgi:hypothetical protein
VTHSLGFYCFFSFSALSTEGKLSKFSANGRSGSEQDLVSEKSLCMPQQEAKIATMNNDDCA